MSKINFMSISTTRKTALDALKKAEDKVKAAIIQQRKKQAISKEVQEALKASFPKKNTSFLPILLKRIQLIRKNVIPCVKLNKITNPVSKTDPDRIFHEYAIKQKVPAAAFPKRRYIALYDPHWTTHKPYQSGILIHEAFHYYFDFIRSKHSTTNTTINAYAYQGFIATLGGIPIGKTLKGNLDSIMLNKHILDICNEYVAPMSPSQIDICKELKRTLD